MRLNPPDQKLFLSCHHVPCPSIHYHQVQYLRNWNCATEQRPRPANTFYGRPDTFSVSINHCMLISRLILSPEPLSPYPPTLATHLFIVIYLWTTIHSVDKLYYFLSRGITVLLVLLVCHLLKTVSCISFELNGFFRWHQDKPHTICLVVTLN